MTEDTLRCEIVKFGALLYARGLAHGSAGNLSIRLDDGAILVTPTNSSLGSLTPVKISKVSPAGDLLAGNPPSKEAFFHLAVYEERPSAKAIVHLHSTHAVALSCICHDDSANVLPPLTAYQMMRVGRLPLVPYYRPGDRKLAEAVRRLAGGHKAMLLANHGPIVSGTSLQDAVHSFEELEETAKLFFLVGNRPVSLLTCEAIVELSEAFPS
ncbi:3-oxo-tetronate 4-phosphate decarboxylase [Neorhizobium galegae]|uniref:3-oxo-tetronate 4-phosphate decarboxylase n=1 Tax=Neorhizobium galegae bv. orientalis str. HAMBI 540 TaxID=1028800 RepID=A0A068T069_NEOGA|nr:3-oxo-tetronate 4-phosphate decarboxylase [Neorhizobium galegae]MCQ1854192.1 aldolase [Neorhizobium galegae]CDN51842.1 Predicted class II aldolase [Neorhizobium galegae bv. orientalis str. HAMBI 540]CDZ51762.1 Putative aldolase class 2 protein YgbL [Neorhizobium galegae bv. orientalis]